MSLYTLRTGVPLHPETTVLQHLTDMIKTAGVLNVDNGDLLVEQPDGGGLNVDVAAGRAYLKKSSSTNAYPARNTATETVAIDSNSSGNPRVDAIVLYLDLDVVPDSEGSQGEEVLFLDAVKGSPAASPSAPDNSAIETAIGASNPYIVLAYVDVANGAVGISDSEITDKRTQVELSEMLDSYITGKRRQAIINGNFDIWQRGTDEAWSSGYIAADKWRGSNTTAVAVGTMARQEFTAGQTDVPNNPRYYCEIDITDVNGATAIALQHRIEDVRTFGGKFITLSFYAKADAALDVVSSFTQYFGSGGSTLVSIDGDTHSLTTSWQKFTVTVFVPSISGKTIGSGEDHYLQLNLDFPTSGTYTIDIAQVQINEGTYALPFMTKTATQELTECLRYCYVHQSDSDATSKLLGVGLAATTTVVQVPYQLPQPMRKTPSLTGTAADWKVSDGINAYDVTSLTLQSGFTGEFTVMLRPQVASGLTAFRPYYLYADSTAGRILIFSADL